MKESQKKKWCTGLDFEIKAFEVRISRGFMYVLKCNGYTYQHMYKMAAANDRSDQLCMLPVYFVLPLSLPSSPPLDISNCSHAYYASYP